ncbi:MAG: FAD-dependent oxidoreductase, partial [Rhizorhabdus sp.]
MIAASIPEECDIVVVGSGAAGMLAAVRAHDLGMSVVMIEKTAYYGGTSAVSGGGIWVPMNADIANQDSPAAALEYLEGCTRGAVPTTVLAAYVEQAPIMARYLSEGAEVPLSSILPLPDYLSRLPGAARGRTLAPGDMDGKALGED